MNHTQHRRRRPLVAMPGHALALSGLQSQSDKADAARMSVFARLREQVNSRARMLLLSGLAGFQR